MIGKKILPVLFIAGAMAVALPACKHKPSDADVQAKVAAAIAQYPGITADVKDGVVTLSGNVTSADDKSNIESAVNALSKEGVQNLTDNIQVTPPPPPIPAVVVSPADSALTVGVKDATKDFPGITATVNNGIITVTGTVEQSKVKILKQALDALHPKKTDMSAVKVQ
jgi:osmotically-inducible protein OsmY